MTRKKAFGDSWWADKFNQSLEGMGWANRLPRGRTYARKGAVLSIDIKGAQVNARVQGTRTSPYKVQIQFQIINDGQWEQVISGMARQALFAAALLNGEMPQDIETVFAHAGVSLFPRAKSDLYTKCSCPDSANPCKHIAAVYYLLGQQFDEDPFLMFELRGLSRQELLQRLNQERQALKTGSVNGDQPVGHPAATNLLANSSIDFMNTLINVGHDQKLDPRNPAFWKGKRVPEYQPSWEAPPGSALILRTGTPPPDWQGPDFIETMEKMYHSSSEKAQTLIREAGIPISGGRGY